MYNTANMLFINDDTNIPSLASLTNLNDTLTYMSDKIDTYVLMPIIPPLIQVRSSITNNSETDINFDLGTADTIKIKILLNLQSYYSTLKHMIILKQYNVLRNTSDSYNQVGNPLNKSITSPFYDKKLEKFIRTIYDNINLKVDKNTLAKSGSFSKIILEAKNEYKNELKTIQEIITDSTKDTDVYNTSKSIQNVLSHDSIIYDYLLYIVFVYILLTILFFIQTSINAPNEIIKYVYISLTITIVFYITTALLSFLTTTNESFVSPNTSHITIYNQVFDQLTVLSRPYGELNNTILDDFVDIINKETSQKKKKTDINKLISEYNLNKITSINNNEKHSSKFNKDFTELLYMLLIILLVGILLYDYFDNIYIVSGIIIPVYSVLILSFFVNMHRKTQTSFNRKYW